MRDSPGVFCERVQREALMVMLCQFVPFGYNHILPVPRRLGNEINKPESDLSLDLPLVSSPQLLVLTRGYEIIIIIFIYQLKWSRRKLKVGGSI